MSGKKPKAPNTLKLGYYAQILFVKNGDQIGIPNDLYLALLEFTKHCEEVVLFLNHSTNSNRDTFALPPKCRLVDLGPNQPMWKRLFGYGFDKNKFVKEAEKLDAIIIQGPTPLLYHLAKPLKKPKIFFLIVGMIVGAFPGQFRSYGFAWRGGELDHAVKDILESTKDVPHIFNLGHGIHKETPIEHVDRVLELVRAS